MNCDLKGILYFFNILNINRSPCDWEQIGQPWPDKCTLGVCLNSPCFGHTMVTSVLLSVYSTLE